jgi:hypothetical protein
MKEENPISTCSTTIALTVATRDLLQKIGFPSERYDDTIKRLSDHYVNCPFAQLQIATVRVLQRISASDGSRWAYPEEDENVEQYATRIINKLKSGDTLSFKGLEKLQEEDDMAYLLRLILAGIKK